MCVEFWLTSWSVFILDKSNFAVAWNFRFLELHGFVHFWEVLINVVGLYEFHFSNWRGDLQRMWSFTSRNWRASTCIPNGAVLGRGSMLTKGTGSIFSTRNNCIFGFQWFLCGVAAGLNKKWCYNFYKYYNTQCTSTL